MIVLSRSKIVVAPPLRRPIQFVRMLSFLLLSGR